MEMAKLLESHIRSDPHFEIPAERHLGLVVFRLKVCVIALARWSCQPASHIFSSWHLGDVGELLAVHCVIYSFVFSSHSAGKCCKSIVNKVPESNASEWRH